MGEIGSTIIIILIIMIFLAIVLYFGTRGFIDENINESALIPCEQLQVLPEDFIGPLAPYQIRSDLPKEEIVNCEFIEEVKLKWIQ